MSYGPGIVSSKSVASAGTSTSGYDLARSWKNCYLEIPTLTSNTEIYIQGSSDGTTFRRIMDGTPKKEILTFTVTMASLGTTTGNSLDLGYGAFTNRHISHPSFATSTQMFIHGSNDNATFVRITHPEINSSTVAQNDFTILSGTSARWIPIPDQFRYLKVNLGSGTTNIAHSFTVLGYAEQRLTEFRIPSAITGRFVPIPTTFRYLKVEASATIDDGATFKIICSD